MNRRFFLCCSGLALVAVCALPAYAQSYPLKAVRVVIPFPVGGNTDVYARPVSQKMAELYGQQMVVDNRPGAGGTIGVDLVAKAPPDGYTLLWGTTSSHGVGPNVHRKLPYDPVKDFEPVILAVLAQSVLTVHPSVPVKSVKDLVALAKARPAALNYASSGNGTMSHLAGELFKHLTATRLVHVPYKGSTPALVDLISGQVQVMFGGLGSSLAHVKTGRLRALAVTGPSRFAALSELPTIAEAGVPGYEVTTWLAIFAPAKTPREVVAKLNGDVNGILRLPDIARLMSDQGATPGGGPPELLGKHVQTEIARWGKVVKVADIRVE
jgi:tripartite-type tricarboxylate transporter receptor subunit TctC